ncbi:kinase-like domain-containing protein [Lactarius deliciosus]|nr:kinase-like domain-containing protein [Lactarius deliciosus]
MEERSAVHVGAENGRREIGVLFSSELWWRDRYRDIGASGYRLRPRYDPDWQPSWKTSRKDFFTTEDGQPTLLRAGMDATRISDGKQVMLKKVLPEEGPHELSITRYFSSPELRDDSRNHCVQLLDVIDTADTKLDKRLMVMPFLRPFNDPHLQTFGEFVAFFMQICEGLQFMHERNVAHRDCTENNIMFDPSGMYPKGYHPVRKNRSRDFKGRAKRYTRTDRPPRYYLIDFGLSRRYSSRDVLDEPLRGGDKNAPEHLGGGRCNPFPVDIYYLGNLVREQTLQKCNGFEFMRELVDSMTNEIPERRPTIEAVIERFDHIRDSLSTTKLRSLISLKKDPRLFTASLSYHRADSSNVSLRYALGEVRTNQYSMCLRRQGGLGTRERGTLVKSELWWRDHYYDLEERGYKLRPRYHPRWKPSWINSKKDFFSVEDGQPTIVSRPYELEINQLFSSPELANDPRNHCTPLLDLIKLQSTESHKIMVFPLLRPFDCPRFQTFGEFVAFFTQMCEGLQFMHQYNVAHRDCTANNVMLEPSKMYPTGFHPVKRDRNKDFKDKATAYTRTQRPPRYLFIDLGLSRQYPTRDIIDEPLHGGDRTAPEIKSRKWSNPFHTDVYYIGNLVRGEFIRVRSRISRLVVTVSF